MWRRALLALVVGLSSVVGAACHGFLAEPLSRNALHNSEWCPHCLNGPEVCGDPRGQHNHERGGRYAAGSVPPQNVFVEGGVIRARIVITANHKGRWSLGLCTKNRETPGCFKKLRLAHGGGKYVYVPDTASSSSGTFKLPRGVRCSRCTVRWLWETSNSCNPPGMPASLSNPGLLTCGEPHAPPMETFTNCADVSVV